MSNLADSFVQVVLYLCFLALVLYIAAKGLFSLIYWFFQWMAA